MNTHVLSDSGLMPDRTQLAWRRTVLSLLVGGLLALRVLPPTLGSWSFAACVLILGLTALLWLLAQRRAQVVDRALRDARPLPGGAVLLFSAVLLSAISVLALVYVAAR